MQVKVYWNDCGRGLTADAATRASCDEACRIWSDEVRGIKGNFLGLTDEDGRTVQLYFTAGIPDHIEDAGHLKIVLVDFPIPAQGGSYQARVTIQQVQDLIRKAYSRGVHHAHFDVSFVTWSQT